MILKTPITIDAVCELFTFDTDNIVYCDGNFEYSLDKMNEIARSVYLVSEIVDYANETILYA